MHHISFDYYCIYMRTHICTYNVKVINSVYRLVTGIADSHLLSCLSGVICEDLYHC